MVGRRVKHGEHGGHGGKKRISHRCTQIHTDKTGKVLVSICVHLCASVVDSSCFSGLGEGQVGELEVEFVLVDFGGQLPL